MAVFGRVSSGKSSLLNHFLHEEILPVGVNPITSVPTRIVSGRERVLDLRFVDRRHLRLPLETIAEYVTEEHNPGNVKEVVSLVAELPNPRLHDGLTLVDTPGLGSLATKGSEETMVYLPRADHAMVLISAASPLNEDDLSTLRALLHAGITISVLLSKADLLPPADLQKAVRYTGDAIHQQLGIRTPVFPVSNAPDHAEALERWFTRHLIPLAENHREHSRLAVRRKIGVLRENVVATLEAKRDTERNLSPGMRTRLEQAESELRQAAGEIEEFRQYSLQAVDGIRDHWNNALQKISQELYAAAKSPEDKDGDRIPLITRIACSEAADASSPLLKSLRRLARDLEAPLKKAGLSLGRTPSEDRLASLIREIPRFDLSLAAFTMRTAGFLFWWPSLAKRWIHRTLTANAGPAIEQAFANYSRALAVWVRQVLADLSAGFHRQADMYRGELATRLGDTPTSGQDAEAIARDIELVRSLSSVAPADRAAAREPVR